MSNNWIKSKQNGILINLDNIADITIQTRANEYVLKAYTHSGFGMVIFEGTKADCEQKQDLINHCRCQATEI